MKTKSIIIVISALLIGCGSAFADWSVTVSNWTPSAGPNLSYEEVQLDGAVQCTVNAGDSTTCNFVVPNLTNQEVSIVSFNDQGTASTPHVVGNLLSAPAPASGGVINITIVSP